MVVCGGYFLTHSVTRPPHVAAELMPPDIVSLSECIGDFIPNVWAVDWTNASAEERALEAGKFGITEAALPEIVAWTTEQVNAGTLGWPCVFFSTGEARSFAQRFLQTSSNLRMLGIGLPEELVSEFFTSNRPEPSTEAPGIYKAIGRVAEIEAGGKELGWDLLCYNHGGYCSWLCNGLERDVAKDCGVKPNPAGFISSVADALKAAEYCAREDVGAEPGFWAPWLVVEFPNAEDEGEPTS